MGIAFMPIEIDVQLPDEQKLIDYANHYSIRNKYKKSSDKEVFELEKFWDQVPVIGRLDSNEWYDQRVLSNAIFNRYNPGVGGPCRYANDIDKQFPEIPYMLDQLPFKELSIVVLFKQHEQVSTHIDLQKWMNIQDESEIAFDLEPRRYNILMTKHHYKSFYICENQNSERIFPNIPAHRPCHALCESQHWHGAEYAGPDKIQLAVYGILDRPKHREMVRKNLEKFKDEVISF